MLQYALTFILLALTGTGLPLPEESVLLLAAYFGATGANPWYLAAAAILGIAVADTLQYVRGRYRWRLFRHFKPGHKMIASMGFFAVFISRFFITARTVMPFMAGSMRMPRFYFHLASLLSATISSVVLIIGGGWFYGVLARHFPQYATGVWIGVLIVLTGWLIMHGTRNQLQLLKK